MLFMYPSRFAASHGMGYIHAHGSKMGSDKEQSQSFARERTHRRSTAKDRQEWDECHIEQHPMDQCIVYPVRTKNKPTKITTGARGVGTGNIEHGKGLLPVSQPAA